MAYLRPELDDDGDSSRAEDFLEFDDVGPVREEDSLINTKGASLNYTLHMIRTGGPFCADKDSLKGKD